MKRWKAGCASKMLFVAPAAGVDYQYFCASLFAVSELPPSVINPLFIPSTRLDKTSLTVNVSVTVNTANPPKEGVAPGGRGVAGRRE